MIYGWHARDLARYGVKVIAPPVAEQITLAEAKLHLRVDNDEEGSPAVHPDDTLIQTLITVAREWAEGYLARSLAAQTLELATSRFPGTFWDECTRGPTGWHSYEYWALPLPMGPVTAVQSVTYAASGTPVAFTDYAFASYVEPARLVPNSSWPTADPSPEAIKVRYEAGYDLPGSSPAANALPKPIKAAMLLLIGGLYENREDPAALQTGSIGMLPLGIESLLDPYRLRLGMA
jgi:uncharacterized phiE125 gp8 family phage protein